MIPSTRVPAAASILSRHEEIARANGLIGRALHGNGGVLLVEGSAGIGKTRLLSEIGSMASDSGLVVLPGRASELEKGFAFGLVSQAVEPALERIDATDRARLFTGVVRPARAAFGGEFGADGEGKPEVHAVLNGLFWLLARLADRAPVLLALDDVHWADESSLLLLSFMVPRVESVPLLVVATARCSS